MLLSFTSMIPFGDENNCKATFGKSAFLKGLSPQNGIRIHFCTKNRVRQKPGASCSKFTFLGLLSCSSPSCLKFLSFQAIAFSVLPIVRYRRAFSE